MSIPSCAELEMTIGGKENGFFIEQDKSKSDGDDDLDGLVQENKSPESKNNFQIRRNVCMQMLDVALLMANVSQLRTLLDSESARHYTVVLSLLVASISCHVISAVLLYVLFIVERVSENKKTASAHDDDDLSGKKKNVTGACSFCSRNQKLCNCWLMYKIDSVATLFVFVVTVLNVFITAFMTSK